jgi:hypothetical protein
MEKLRIVTLGLARVWHGGGRKWPLNEGQRPYSLRRVRSPRHGPPSRERNWAGVAKQRREASPSRDAVPPQSRSPSPALALSHRWSSCCPVQWTGRVRGGRIARACRSGARAWTTLTGGTTRPSSGWGLHASPWTRCIELTTPLTQSCWERSCVGPDFLSPRAKPLCVRFATFAPLLTTSTELSLFDLTPSDCVCSDHAADHTW